MAKVTVQPSGKSFETEPDETILDAAIRHDIVLPYGCRSGQCGTCKSNLLKGDVTYDDPDSLSIDAEERARGAVLTCQAKPVGDVVIEARTVDAVADLEVRTLPARVRRMRKFSDDVMGVWLQLPASQRIQFLAGMYLEILLKNGETRAFSMANAPEDDELIELHIRHVPGGLFTDHVFNKMKEKDLLKIRAPLGTFFLREDERPIIFMVGGTGFAPAKSIIEHMIHQQSERPLHLFWGVRAASDLYLDELPEQWTKQLPGFRYTPVLSEPDEKDHWRGETGWVHEAVVRHYPDLAGYDVYACGPPPMIEAGKKLFSEHGLDQDRLFFDSFEFALKK